MLGFGIVVQLVGNFWLSFCSTGQLINQGFHIDLIKPTMKLAFISMGPFLIVQIHMSQCPFHCLPCLFLRGDCLRIHTVCDVEAALPSFSTIIHVFVLVPFVGTLSLCTHLCSMDASIYNNCFAVHELVDPLQLLS